MEEVPSVEDVCILLVDADPTSLASTSMLLLKSKYEVLTANQGEDALSVLRSKQQVVHLVLTDIKLPDMCTFEFVEIVEKETRLPVIMICDTYDEHTMKRGLFSGAMCCLVKPLCLDDVRDLWQYPIAKEREVMLESNESQVIGFPEGVSMTHYSKEREITLESLEFLETIFLEKGCTMYEKGCSSQGSRKRKIEEIEKVEGLSSSLMERPSSFIWTPYLQDRFLQVVDELGFYNAAPLEVLRRMNAPGLTVELVMERLQQYHMCSKQQQKLKSKMVSPCPTSLDPQKPPLMADCSMNQGIGTSYSPTFTNGLLPPLTGFLPNPYCRNQLKGTAVETPFRCLAEYEGYAKPKPTVWGVNNVGPVHVPVQQPLMQTLVPSFVPFSPETSETPPAPVPGALTKAVERLMQLSSPFPVFRPPSEPMPAPVLGPLGEDERENSRLMAPLPCPTVASEVQGDGEAGSSLFSDDVLDAIMGILD